MPGEYDGGNRQGDAGEQGNKPAWMASLPDAYKGSERFAQFQEPGQAWERFDKLLEAEGRSVTIPGENATDAERAAFYAKLGRPETPDKYNIKKPEGMPEDMPYSPELEKAFREFAHAKGMPDKMAAELHEWFYGISKDGHLKAQADVKAKQESAAKEAQAALDKAINGLKDEWKGDDFKVNTELALRAFTQFSGTTPEAKAEAKKFVEETKIGNLALGDHPTFLKIFATIGKAISDDSMDGGRGANPPGGGSDEEKAQARFPNTQWK